MRISGLFYCSSTAAFTKSTKSYPACVITLRNCAFDCAIKTVCCEQKFFSSNAFFGIAINIIHPFCWCWHGLQVQWAPVACKPANKKWHTIAAIGMPANKGGAITTPTAIFAYYLPDLVCKQAKSSFFNLFIGYFG